MMRLLGLILFLFILPANAHARDQETDSKKALEVFIGTYHQQDEKTKSQVLRELALLKEERAVAFLARVAADYGESSDTRREALKGLIAALPKFGPYVENILRRTRIAVSPTLQAFREFKDPNFVEGLAMLLLHASEDDLKEYIPTFLYLWNGQELPKSFKKENAKKAHKRLSFFQEFLSKRRKEKLQTLLKMLNKLSK